MYVCMYIYIYIYIYIYKQCSKIFVTFSKTNHLIILKFSNRKQNNLQFLVMNNFPIHFKVLLKTQLYSKTSYLTLSRLLIFQQENKIHCLVLITIFVTLQWSIMNKLKNGPSWHNNMLQQQAIFQGLYFRFERLVPEWQNHPLNEIKRVLQYSRIL